MGLEFIGGELKINKLVSSFRALLFLVPIYLTVHHPFFPTFYRNFTWSGVKVS